MCIRDSYQPNLGNPLPLIREQLLKIYKEHPGLQVVSVTTTGSVSYTHLDVYKRQGQH